MSLDIRNLLDGWDYKPHEISVRTIKGDDGKEKIQLRLDLGLLQMEIDGRPDGKRPHRRQSLFDYYKFLLKKIIEKYGTDENFVLNTDETMKLYQESVQYYHRYLSFFHLEDYKRAERDTKRNLEVMDFVENYAASDDDVFLFLQYRPYLIMMNTRARAHLALDKKDYKKTLSVVKAGIKAIENFYKEMEEDNLIDASRELELLNDMYDKIEKAQPKSKRQRLESELEMAIQIQDYERAAHLRDEIKKIKNRRHG